MEELKKNIDDMLQQMGGEGNSGEDEESGESDEEEQEEGQSEQQDTSEREQQIQQQLEEMMQDNMEERQDVQEWYSQEGSYNQYNGKTW